MTGPPVTVLIAARNEQRRLGRCLQRLRRQTVQDDRVIVVDDGSADATRRIAEDEASRDDRIRVLHTAGLGLAGALNYGIERCDTEFIARLDPDDVSLRRRLGRQLQEFADNPAAVAVGTYGLRINEWGLPVGRLTTGPRGREGHVRVPGTLPYINITHSSVMYRTAAVRRVGGYPEEYKVGSDAALFSRLAEIGEVYAIPKLLTLYRLSRVSMSAGNILLQEIAAERLRIEAQRGERFASFEEFYADKDADPRWPARQDELLERAVRRRFSRALANGQVIAAWRIARDGGIQRRMLRDTAQRVISG